jgi:hypothetical protein
MREICMSGSMSGEGKPPAASRSRSSALPRLYARIIGKPQLVSRQREAVVALFRRVWQEQHSRTW